MYDLATARACFLAKVHDYAPGQAVRFTPALDDLIQWSEANGLVHAPSKVAGLVKFSAPGSRLAFWSATPRTGDGAKFVILGEAKFPESLRSEAREAFAGIGGTGSTPEGVPAMPFTKLIWAPYRTRVLDLMARLFDGVSRAEAEAPGTAVA